MKNQVFLSLLCFLYFNTWSQQFVKTTTPCNNELLKKTAGRWIKTGEAYHAKISQQQQKEIQNRLNAFHQLMFNLYPSPVAFDAIPSFCTDDKELNGDATVYYSYTGFFCAYTCGRETYEMMRGYPRESGTEMSIHVNFLENIFLHSITDKPLIETMRIDGRPIKSMPVLVGKWKGYDVYVPETGSGEKIVLLHRLGVLPYIPVTRKQYLEKCLVFLPKFFAPDPNGLKNVELWGGDKKAYEEQLKKMEKIKDDVLKYYQAELRATTSTGLLDSPAIISGGMADIGTSNPIFTTQASGGRMLVTVAPSYIKICQNTFHNLWFSNGAPVNVELIDLWILTM